MPAERERPGAPLTSRAFLFCVAPRILVLHRPSAFLFCIGPVGAAACPALLRFSFFVKSAFRGGPLFGSLAVVAAAFRGGRPAIRASSRLSV